MLKIFELLPVFIYKHMAKKFCERVIFNGRKMVCVNDEIYFLDNTDEVIVVDKEPEKDVENKAE